METSQPRIDESQPGKLATTPAPRAFLRSAAAVGVAVLLGLLLVGWIDYATGVEVRAFPLYFLPLALAARRLGLYPAVGFAVLATLVWVVALAAAGRHYSNSVVWLINSLTQGSAFVLFSVLVARLQAALVREQKLARFDLLTGLPNRREFYRLAAREVLRCQHTGKAVTLVYLDLDNFKGANDQFGHARGDLVLGEVGRILLESLRTRDVVGRLGGDEFAVCLPETDATDAQLVLDRLHAEFATAADLTQSGVTVSIGAVAAEGGRADLDTLVQAADAVLYRVKASGRNRTEVDVLGPAVAPLS